MYAPMPKQESVMSNTNAQKSYNPTVYWAQRLGVSEMPTMRSFEWAILDISDSDIHQLPERIPIVSAQIFHSKYAAFARPGEPWKIRDASGNTHWIGAIATIENMQFATGTTSDHDAPTNWPDKCYYLTVPIADGSLLLVSTNPIDTKQLTYFTRTVTAFHARAQEISRKSQMAVTDAMTGLFNRRGLEEAIVQIDQTYGIIYADLDNLKKLNDTHSHEIGDMYILAAVTMLKKSIRDHDIIARVGGDEFVILALTNRKEQDVAEAVQNVVDRIKSNMNTVIHGVPLSMSIGTAIVPNDGDFVNATVIADKRMQENKRTRKAGRTS